MTKGLFCSLLTNMGLALCVTALAMQQFYVEPSRRTAAHEGIKALIRGENICRDDPEMCAYVIEKNREIAERTLTKTLDYEARGEEWEYDVLL